ncbi:PREDICTED: protein FRG2-like-2 [Condylura cristata]|uniref:protein FRG2-like-2 n=1 Tax=Condylura cristata TaxID=143302 RepID=UPI0003344B4E|nr:PREDICTED: protein FRG2-like-2 [Condylura cristata]
MPPIQQNSAEEGRSDVEEKALEGAKAMTCEQNSKETELKDRNGSVGESESKSNSNSEARSSRKRKLSPRKGSPDGTGPSSEDEHPEVLHREEGKVPKGNSSEGVRDSRCRRPHRRRPGCSKKPRASFPRGQPPPLRKTLVTSLRSVSEAIYQDMVWVQRQQVQAPLGWEDLSALAQLRAPLADLVQTIYTMASQAAYAIPAEGWLSPTPPPGALGLPGTEDKAGVLPASKRSPLLPLDK